MLGQCSPLIYRSCLKKDGTGSCSTAQFQDVKAVFVIIARRAKWHSAFSGQNQIRRTVGCYITKGCSPAEVENCTEIIYPKREIPTSGHTMISVMFLRLFRRVI